MEGNKHERMTNKHLSFQIQVEKDWAMEAKLQGGHWVLMSKTVFPKTKAHLLEYIGHDDPVLTNLRFNKNVMKGPIMERLTSMGYELPSRVEVMLGLACHFIKFDKRRLQGSMYQINNFGKNNENVVTVTNENYMGWAYLVGCFNKWDVDEEDHYSIGVGLLDDENLVPYIGYCGVKRFGYTAPPNDEAD